MPQDVPLPPAPPVAAPAILDAAPPSRGEAVPPGEPAAIDTIKAAIRAQVQKQAEADHVAHRDAHAKAHGTVRAKFEVRADLPEALRVGIFAAPRAFDALIRFSNGAGCARPDLVPDGRGMAIKLLGVAGSASGTQDFLMIDNPAFFVRNAADYAVFSTAQPQGSFFVNFTHPRLHEAAIAAAIAARPACSPLAVRYFSMTPYAIGARACKYAASPVPPLPATCERFLPDFMRRCMIRHLAENDATFDFLVQLQTDPLQQPIEDPTIEWPEETAPFVAVARITIPRQNFDTEAQRELGENLSFTPWHALPEHQPLGGINRVRRVVYEAISEYRHSFNNAPRAEPAALPPLTPPNPPGQEITIPKWFEREFLQQIGGVAATDEWLTDTANRIIINQAVGQTRTRPHPWSTFSPLSDPPVPSPPTAASPFVDYPCWDGLTDRTFLAMHLRPAPPPAGLPAVDDVKRLFARPDGRQRVSTKSTCLFPAFAQYLTDGFIRTNPTDTRRTTSNHEIDLCPLYGRTREQTNALRLRSEIPGQRGRLRSQRVRIGESEQEFSPALYDQNGKLADQAFLHLDAPLLSQAQKLGPPPQQSPLPPDQAASLFAVGGDRVNASPFAAMINTLLLREHNRVAGMLDDLHPDWDDEHVFQISRNIMIPMFIKIVVEEYINHIIPYPVKLKADPSVAWTANWNRPNWMTEEFSLLYRWHSLMPDQINWPGGPIPLTGFTLDNRRLLQLGLDGAFTAASAQEAAELGAFNTERNLLLYVEQASINQGRNNHLPPYAAYCAAFNHKAINNFADISTNPDVQALLQQLYGTPDRVEFYPGLFAEDRVPCSPLPGLLMTMVAVDAFSQALTNPLLSEHIWGDESKPGHVGARDLAFTPEGFDLIVKTSTLGDILRRQGRPDGAPKVTMTQLNWRYVEG